MEKLHNNLSSTLHDDQQNNLMPSMVVRQQKLQTGANLFQNLIKPTNPTSEPQTQHLFDQDGLILPKRLPQHSNNNNSQQYPIIRDLNRELKFNQIRGKNVLDQKCELKKVQEKMADARKRREAEQERLNRRSSLEMRLEERAQKLAKESND